MPSPAYPFASRSRSRGDSLLGSGGALPVLFSLNSEIAEELPGASTFTRASTAQISTTTDDVTDWSQTAKSGEVRLRDMRRAQNQILNDLSSYSLQTSGAGVSPIVTPNFANGVDGASLTATRVQLEAGGTASVDQSGLQGNVSIGNFDGARQVQSYWMILNSGTSEDIILRDRTGAELPITITDSWQRLAFNGEGSSSGLRAAFRAVGSISGAAPIDILIDEGPDNPIVLELVQDSADGPGPATDKDVIYNAEVTAVQYLATTGANTIDGNGLVTENPGTTITGGGYLSEPLAANRLLRSNDLTDAAWVKSGAAGAADLAFTDNGGRSSRLTGLGALGVDDVAQTAIGFTNSGLIAPSFLLRRVSATGTLRIVQATDGATGGDWDVDLSAIGTGWVRIEPGSTLLTENTAWTASGAGAAGVTFAASAGGPLSVDVAFVGQEDSEFATSSTITGSSVATRQADVLDTGATIDSDFGAFLDVTLPDVIGAGNTITLLGADATAVDILRVDAGGNVIMDDGGTPVTIGTAALGTRITVSYGRDATGRSASLDSAPVVTGGAPGAGHQGNTFQIGAANSVNQSRSIHHLTTLYAVRPSDEELVELPDP